ncbi:MAG: DUF7507 domain-containing protein [Blautia sp.]|jgi:LPXTG-motif cell wall-anchored protein
MKKRIIGRVRGALSLLLLTGLLGSSLGARPAAADTTGQVTLEKTAAWTDEAAYQAEVCLKVSGIEAYTKSQEPISVIPVLDMTNSMNCCESEDHVRPLRMHAISAIPGYKELWEEIKPQLPTKEEYTSYGQESPENLFLNLPEEMDPTHKARLFCCQRDGTDGYGQAVLGGWKVIYVTDDQTPLWNVEESDYAYLYHSVRQNNTYMPVGTMEVKEKRTVWKAKDSKWADYGCTRSRMDDLILGYTRFIEEVFENKNARVCPVAFVGGYYIGDWADQKETALAFLTEERYKEAALVSPNENTGTNLEAAVAGADDALLRAGGTENTFALIFTDGAASSGYVHNEDGSIDMSQLDPHSYKQAQWDTSWYPAFGEWAVEDAAYLKKKVPLYTVGYGYNMKYDDFSQETLKRLSSEGCFIDTREEGLDQILEIFRKIYADMLEKASLVQVTDYISEYWRVDPAALPYGCSVEEAPVKNQRGAQDTIQKLTFSITKEMGADDREEFVIPVTLREEYREVEEKTWYETNQDAPLEKPETGTGAKVRYRDLSGAEVSLEAVSPKLEVSPRKADLKVEKKALKESVTAGRTARYEIRVENTGFCDLTDIQVEDRFPSEDIQGVFEEQEGIVLLEDKTCARIPKLAKGEAVLLYVQAQFPTSISGEQKNIATARAEDPYHPGTTLIREGEAQIQVEASRLDFVVEKKADRESAKAGDTVNYEITISNTGERVLHSVITVDKFTNAHVTARFREQEGVEITENGTKALIPEIQPGSQAVLKAYAVIPEDFTEEKLVNVAVVSVKDEDKEISQEGQAEITVEEETPAPTQEPKETPTDTPAPTETSVPTKAPQVTNHVTQMPKTQAKLSPDTYSSYKGTVGGASPKTGDDSPVAFWLLAGGLGALLGVTVFLFRKQKGNIEKKR